MSWLYTLVFAGLLISNSNEADRSKVFLFQDAKVVSQQTDDVTEKFEQTYPLNPNGRVRVSNVNGSIIVEAWDRNEVRLEATKIADSQESMALMEIVVNARQDFLEIETEYKHWTYNSNDKNRRRRAEVQYRLQVPRGAILNEIETVNGTVEVSNFTNLIKVSAVNGTVIANNLRGTIKLSTVNGEVKTNFERLERGTSVSLDTVNGRVNLELPSDVNATVKADSLNGGITNDLGLTVRKGKYVGRDLHGRLGTGEVQVKLSSINGGLSISRRKDGRTPSQVTNLVKAESEDEDSNEEYLSQAASADRAIAEAVRSGAKASQKAAKETHKAVEKIKPADYPKAGVPEMPDVKLEINEKAAQKIATDNLRGQREAIRVMNNAVWRSTPTAIDQKTNSFPVKGTPKVTIDAPKCKVLVRGWDQPTVKYILTESRVDRSQPLSVNEDVGEKSVSLVVAESSTARLPSRWGDENVIRLEVFVPKKSDLTVHTEQEIRLQGVSGDLELKGADEPVSIRDSEGNLRLTSTDGLVRVVGFKGKLDLETGDSEVYLEGDFDKIDSHAVDGNITLTLPPNKNASISTNAAIESEGLNIVRENGRTWKLGNGGSKYDFEFSDGTLRVRSRSLIETN